MKRIVEKYLTSAWIPFAALAVVSLLLMSVISNCFQPELFYTNQDKYFQLRELGVQLDKVQTVITAILYCGIIVAGVFQLFKGYRKRAVISLLIAGFLYIAYIYNERTACARLRLPEQEQESYLAELQTISKELEMYKQKHGRYPKNMKDIERYGFHFLYLSNLNYQVMPDGKAYELRHYGYDSKFGTVDDVVWR